jgi:hypothetical protein
MFWVSHLRIAVEVSWMHLSLPHLQNCYWSIPSVVWKVPAGESCAAWLEGVFSTTEVGRYMLLNDLGTTNKMRWTWRHFEGGRERKGGGL